MYINETRHTLRSSSVSFSYSSPPWLGAVKKKIAPILRLSHHIPLITAPSLQWCLAMGLIYSMIIYFDSTYTAAHLTTHRGIYYLHVEQFLVLYALMGFLDMLGLLVCFLPLFRTLWFRMEDYRLVVYREVGSIPEELLLGQGRVVSI
jgi:hypothetical protein